MDLATMSLQVRIDMYRERGFQERVLRNLRKWPITL